MSLRTVTDTDRFSAPSPRQPPVWRLQFAFMPMNFLGTKSKIDFLETGFWGGRARTEAEKYASVHTVAEAVSDMQAKHTVHIKIQTQPARTSPSADLVSGMSRLSGSTRR